MNKFLIAFISAIALFLSACSQSESQHAKTEEEASQIAVRMITTELQKNGSGEPTDWQACSLDGNKVLVGYNKTAAVKILLKKEASDLTLSMTNADLRGKFCNAVPQELITEIKATTR